MGCALTFMVGMGGHALVSYKDVKIDPNKRTSKVTYWGTEEEPTVLSKAVHWNSWQKQKPQVLFLSL